MSGCFANPTPNTGYEPNFHSYMNEEHTPINLPDSHRSFQYRDDATSSSKQTAASRVPTMLGFLAASLWKQRPESVDSRASIQATGANVDRESVAPTIVSSQSKGRRDRDQNVVHALKDRKSPENPLTES